MLGSLYVHANIVIAYNIIVYYIECLSFSQYIKCYIGVVLTLTDDLVCAQTFHSCKQQQT